MRQRSAIWLLLRGDARQLWRAPGQTLFTLVGICIAVALVVGVDLANDAARRGYDLGFTRLNAGVTHTILRRAGPLQDRDYVRLLALWRAGALPDVRALLPNVNGRLRRVAATNSADEGRDQEPVAGRAVDLLGVDLLADRAVRASSAQLQLIPALLSEAGTVVAGRDGGWQIGQDYVLARGTGKSVSVRVAGLVAGPDNAAGGSPIIDYRDLLFADIATAQELLGQIGFLSRIDVQLSCSVTTPAFSRWFPGLTPTRPLGCASALERALPGEYKLQSLAALRDDDLASGEAFYFNLGALSLLAAAVAALLVYQVVVLGVNRRALDFGRLRALGMTGRQLGVRVVGDYLLLALSAALIGVVLGHLLASALVTQVAGVVDDLFYRLTVTDLRWTWFAVGKGVCVALTVALAASIGPAWRLAHTPVAMLLRGELERRAKIPPTWIALGCGALAAILLLCSDAVWAALASIACLLIGAAAAIGRLVPRVTPALFTRAHAARRGRRNFPVLALAFADLGRTGRDASLALGALLVAVATAFGMSWMISSFRLALQQVLTQRLQASVLVRVDVPRPELATLLKRVPGVTAVALAGHGEVTIGALRVPLRVPLRVADDAAREAARLGLVVGDLGAGQVALSEPLARRLRIGPRALLQIGACTLRVGGVFREYGNLRGRVVLGRATAQACIAVPPTTEAELYGPVSVAAVRAALVGKDGLGDGLQIADQARIRRVSLDIFDRTFLITDVVRALALIVAATALFSSLTAWLEQRSRELGMLRAMGLTGPELGALLGVQSLSLGVIAIALAVPLGALIAWVLVAQLQPRAFGWSFALVLQWQVIASTAAAALLAVIAGAALPALLLARTPTSRWLGSARHG